MAHAYSTITGGFHTDTIYKNVGRCAKPTGNTAATQKKKDQSVVTCYSLNIGLAKKVRLGFYITSYRKNPSELFGHPIRREGQVIT